MGVISIKYSYDELKKFIEEKIKSLRNELEFYESLLKMLERVGRTPERGEDRKLKEEVLALKDDEGNIVMTITATPSKIKVVPLIKIEAEHELIKSYLTRFLDEKKSSSISRVSRYDIKLADGYISEILIEGSFNEYFIIELEAALTYIINTISKSRSSD